MRSLFGEDRIGAAYDADNYDELACLYTAWAGYQLASTGYAVGTEYRKAASKILLAISFDALFGRSNRAEANLRFYSEVFERMANESEHPIARGLGFEWLGDAHLFIDQDQTALTYYEQAEPLLSDHDFDTRFYWGGRPECDESGLAFNYYVDEKGLSRDFDPSISFEKRLSWKMELCR